MDRSHAIRPVARLAAVALVVATTFTVTGCAPLLTTGIYLWQGGNVVPAECDALEDQRVVVVCQPPASQEYRHANASQALAVQVSELLVDNVDDIDVVNPSEVDNWADETEGNNFKELARAVNADMVLHIELDDFNLYEGKTLYRGKADVTITVYDMNEKGKKVWSEHLGEILYPLHSGIPAQDKSVQQFEREFVTIVGTRIGEFFYQHDPNSGFALDALSNR
jgi:hypothetical protein